MRGSRDGSASSKVAALLAMKVVQTKYHKWTLWVDRHRFKFDGAGGSDEYLRKVK
jgi:hypothetical protein